MSYFIFFFIVLLQLELFDFNFYQYYLLQEVETEQYYTFFLETLKERGYDGYFCPKSRAKLVSEQERKHVDGCAVFFKTEKWVHCHDHGFELKSRNVTIF